MSDGLSSQNVLLKTDFTYKDYFTIHLIKQINYRTASRPYLKTLVWFMLCGLFGIVPFSL